MKLLFALMVLGTLPVRSAEPAAPGAMPSSQVVVTPALIRQWSAELRTNHPGLRAVAARVRAAQADSKAVRTWEDPRVSFGGAVANAQGTRLSEDGDLIYSLEQPLPLFGKAGANRRMAEAEVDAEGARLTARFEVLRRDLARALFHVALAGRVAEVSAEDLGWLRTTVASTRERFRLGKVSQAELLRVENELAKRVDQLRTDEREREHGSFTVNRLLNRDGHAPLPRLALPEPAGELVYSEALVEHALEFEPKLLVLRREAIRAKAAVAVTRKARLPSLSAGIEGRQYSGDGGFREGTFSVSLTLPWLNAAKYRSDLGREQARAEAVELEWTDARLGLREELHHLIVEVDMARRQAALYREEIVPRSRQALEAALSGWLAGPGLLPEVLEARRQLLDAELVLARAAAEQHQLLADVALASGFPDVEALFQFTAHTQPVSDPAPVRNPSPSTP